MSDRYKMIGNHPFFISPTIVSWIDLFTRNRFCEVVTNSLIYCCANKELILHEYVFMPSHIHLIVQSETGNLPAIIRDFKSFTAKQIIKILLEEQADSRSEWMLRLFKYHAKYRKQNAEYMVWQKTNHAIELFSPKLFEQKKTYIYNNPVKAGYVFKPEDWVNSSAHNESRLQNYLYGRLF